MTLPLRSSSYLLSHSMKCTRVQGRLSAAFQSREPSAFRLGVDRQSSYFSSATFTNNDDNGEGNDSELHSSESSQSSPVVTSRNKALAEIIRGGYHSLNQVALDIQNASPTRKSIFQAPVDKNQQSTRQKAEARLVLDTANKCMEELARQGKLCVQGDPIVLLDVQMKGSKLAIVYWCLPYSVLADETMASREKQLMEFRMHNILQKGGGTQMLQRGVHAALRHYYPPRLQLEPAPDEMLLELMEEIMG